jgi:hypothetical protein
VHTNPSEIIRVEKLRRVSTFVILLEENTGGLVEEGSSRVCRRRRWRESLEKKHLAISKKSSRRRIDGQDSQKKPAKSRQPLDLRKVAQGLSPEEQRKIPEIRSSGYRGFRGRETLKE